MKHLPTKIKLKLNRIRKGKLSTANPLFYIYCCSAFFKMELKIRDKVTGVIYSSNMNDDNKHTITALNFCTSYTQVTVQDEVLKEDGGKIYPEKDIILPTIGTKVSRIDLIATQNDNEAEWVL